jgi:hypothetical protein
MLVERFGVWMVVLIACWSQKHESLGITVVQSNVLLLCTTTAMSAKEACMCSVVDDLVLITESYGWARLRTQSTSNGAVCWSSGWNL